MEGEAGVVVDEEGPSELLLWKRLFTSNPARLGVDEDEGGVADEEDAAADEVDAAEGGIPVENDVVRECILPFVFAAGTEPNVLMPSGLMVGTAAGEDEMGAEVSSMDPKVTEEPECGSVSAGVDCGGRNERTGIHVGMQQGSQQKYEGPIANTHLLLSHLSVCGLLRHP